VTVKYWLVERHGKPLGHFIAEELRLRSGTLLAFRNGRAFGAVAGGPGLTWTESPFPDIGV
jgi:hypothetical protein